MEIRLVEATRPKIPTEFAYVLIMLGAIAIQYVLTMYFFTMKARIACFRRGFMRQFDEMHIKAFPGATKAPQFGYPDSGCGFYGKKLPYAHWF